MTKIRKVVVSILLAVLALSVVSFMGCNEEKENANTYQFYRLYLNSTGLTLGDVYDIGEEYHDVTMKESFVKCTFNDDGTATLVINKALITGLASDEETILTYNGTWSEEGNNITALFSEYQEEAFVGYKHDGKITIDLNSTDAIVLKK